MRNRKVILKIILVILTVVAIFFTREIRHRNRFLKSDFKTTTGISLKDAKRIAEAFLGHPFTPEHSMKSVVSNSFPKVNYLVFKFKFNHGDEIEVNGFTKEVSLYKKHESQVFDDQNYIDAKKVEIIARTFVQKHYKNFRGMQMVSEKQFLKDRMQSKCPLESCGAADVAKLIFRAKTCCGRSNNTSPTKYIWVSCVEIGEYCIFNPEARVEVEINPLTDLVSFYSCSRDMSWANPLLPDKVKSMPKISLEQAIQIAWHYIKSPDDKEGITIEHILYKERDKKLNSDSLRWYLSKYRTSCCAWHGSATVGAETGLLLDSTQTMCDC